MACVVIQSLGIVSTGSDVTPAALNWTAISQIGSGVQVRGTSNSQTVTAIDTPITLRASWTIVGDDNTACWIKNGVAEGEGDSPLDVTVSVNDTLAFRISLIAGLGSSASSGTVTVTNPSDGGAAIDTFTYAIERT